MEILNIKSSGIVCRSDAGLYNENTNVVYFLSIYGSPQQVKGISSSLAMGRDIELLKGNTHAMYLKRNHSDTMRFKGSKIGYGKQYGVIWYENIGNDVIFWMSPNDKLAVFSDALNKRKIPYDIKWLPQLESMLLNNGYLSELQGYGGVGGYICEWDDDAICDLLLETFMKGQSYKQVILAA